MLRLLDANLDRIGEGLRVLGELARFVLEDAGLTARLKALRHEVVPTDPKLQARLLGARNAATDVAAFAEAGDEMQRRDLVHIARANARRIEESVRVLEEFAKLPDAPPGLTPEALQRARFAMYDIERDLVSGLLRQEKKARLAGLYVILDTGHLRGRSAVEVARQIAHGGATAIQLRQKGSGGAALLKLARELKEVCAQEGLLFIINDYTDIAIAAACDGVHLGQEDLPVAEARRMLPLGAIAGCSASNVAEAQQAWQDGADYIGVSAVFATPSKTDATVAGLETLRRIKEAVPLPAVAAGGIDESNIRQVRQAGADGIAVISAVMDAPDVESATRSLVAAMAESPTPGRGGR